MIFGKFKREKVYLDEKANFPLDGALKQKAIEKGFTYKGYFTKFGRGVN